MSYEFFRRVILTHFVIPLFFIFYIYLMAIYTPDGKTYTQSNIFDYYLLTPSLLMKAPKISQDKFFLMQGGDNYGFERYRGGFYD
ncbi:hypothetical protein [Rahnella ecdela]|uniref:Uncharacterized protein n=1 Tax=Rahnella ecdela TaxID=2816250 RepID=A0ABS6LA95_9GAMM|nr:hypothetical protein [Rahnella ecdela]MBU9843856.1 hypothetical protein [Rahnella ecdela]